MYRRWSSADDRQLIDLMLRGLPAVKLRMRSAAVSVP